LLHSAASAVRTRRLKALGPNHDFGDRDSIGNRRVRVRLSSGTREQPGIQASP